MALGDRPDLRTVRDPGPDPVQTQSLSPTEAQAIPYRQGQGLCIVAYEQKAMGFVRGSDPPGGQAVEMRGIRWPNPQ
jgi:hypothetical protein